MIKDPSREYAIVVSNKYAKSLSKIHPLKQRQTEALCKLASELDIVEKVIIFGSATNYKCNSCSDLDVCIKWRESPYINEDFDFKSDVKSVYSLLRATSTGSGFDLVFWDELDGSYIESAVKERGVVVYG